jgi:hypothetical protein
MDRKTQGVSRMWCTKGRVVAPGRCDAVVVAWEDCEMGRVAGNGIIQNHEHTRVVRRARDWEMEGAGGRRGCWTGTATAVHLGVACCRFFPPCCLAVSLQRLRRFSAVFSLSLQSTSKLVLPRPSICLSSGGSARPWDRPPCLGDWPRGIAPYRTTSPIQEAYAGAYYAAGPCPIAVSHADMRV